MIAVEHGHEHLDCRTRDRLESEVDGGQRWIARPCAQTVIAGGDEQVVTDCASRLLCRSHRSGGEGVDGSEYRVDVGVRGQQFLGGGEGPVFTGGLLRLGDARGESTGGSGLDIDLAGCDLGTALATADEQSRLRGALVEKVIEQQLSRASMVEVDAPPAVGSGVRS